MQYGRISTQSPLCSFAEPRFIDRTDAGTARGEQEAAPGTGIFLAVLISAVLWTPPALALSYFFS